MKKKVMTAIAVATNVFYGFSANSDKSASEALDAANKQLTDMLSSALTLFSSICGIFALAGGAVVAYKMFNGDQDSAKKIGSWVGGLVVACVVMMVVKSFFFGK